MSSDLQQLFKVIKVSKYKETPPLKLLYEMFHEIETTLHYGRHRSWEILIELLANWIVQKEDYSLGSLACKGFDGLELRYKDLYNKINEIDLFNAYITALRNNPWDWLGEIFLEQELVGPGQNLTPKAVVDLMIEMTLPKPVTKLQTLLDPCVGSGRFLIEASLLRQDSPLVLFGIEIDPTLYRACLVNMALLSKHPYSIICADALRLDPNLTGPASQIWDYGNRWLPPDVSKFYWKPQPINPKSFSLKAFTEMQDGKSH